MPTVNLGTGALTVNQSSNTTFAGTITGGGTLSKTGGGTLVFTGTNNYTGATTITAGTLLINGWNGTSPVEVQSGATLGGKGILGGPVTVDAGGMVSPAASIGTFTISNNLSLAGNLKIEVSKSVFPSNDLIVVTGSLTNAGTGALTVTNLGAAPLIAGDSFTIFNQPLPGGNALAITGGLQAGLGWQNRLATDGSIAVVSVGQPFLQWAVNNGNLLHFSWTDSGVKLQVQTNTLGIGTNWYDYPGGASSPVDVTVNPACPPVFFRLVSQ
jgi:fibronectin-binding autotransporter adhesin